MKTETTLVTGTVYVFATPKTEYEIANLEAGELPFKYEIKSYDYCDEDSVRVCEFPITGTVPAGIDLTMMAIEGFREQIVEVQKIADQKIERLEEKIKALLLITYQPPVDNNESS